MIIDTHCHYNLDPLHNTWQEYLQNAIAHEVLQAIVVGTSVESSKKAIELTHQSSHFGAAIGIHPEECDGNGSSHREEISNQVNELEKMCESMLAAEVANTLKTSESLIAIGEIGLDYFRLTSADETKKIGQQHLFRAQLSLANTYQLPIIIHSRDKGAEAYLDLEKIVIETLPSGYPLVLHCASGPSDYLHRMVERGAYLGVDGNITYPNSNYLRERIAQCPKNKIVVETDAPFLPPQSHRGKVCEPWMISETVVYLEKQFGISQEQLVENTYRLFTRLPVVH